MTEKGDHYPADEMLLKATTHEPPFCIPCNLDALTPEQLRAWALVRWRAKSPNAALIGTNEKL